MNDLILADLTAAWVNAAERERLYELAFDTDYRIVGRLDLVRYEDRLVTCFVGDVRRHRDPAHFARDEEAVLEYLSQFPQGMRPALWVWGVDGAVWGLSQHTISIEQHGVEYRQFGGHGTYRQTAYHVLVFEVVDTLPNQGGA